MCGIAGAIDLNGRREFSASRLLAMTSAIAHRGPDDEQIHLEPGVALGARRLSIVDLAGGRQPISNEDGSIWVTQNGEIFEYPELQTRIARAGPSAGDAVRHRALGPPLRRPGRGILREDARPVRGGALGPEQPDGHPGPGPGRDLPALLHRGRRLAALGLGDQGPLVVGLGGRAARSQGDRPVLQHVLRRHDADVFRGDQIDPAGPFSADSRRPGRAQEILGPRLPRCRRRAPARRSDARWSTSWNS